MIPPLTPDAPAQPVPTERKAAGTAFEALILQQMLGAVLPEAAGAGGIALQALSRELAEASPFGLARLLETRT
jgi:hypothetical protein